MSENHKQRVRFVICHILIRKYGYYDVVCELLRGVKRIQSVIGEIFNLVQKQS